MKQSGKNLRILAAVIFLAQLSSQLMAANIMKLSTHTVGVNQPIMVRVDINNSCLLYTSPSPRD